MKSLLLELMLGWGLLSLIVGFLAGAIIATGNDESTEANRQSDTDYNDYQDRIG